LTSSKKSLIKNWIDFKSPNTFCKTNTNPKPTNMIQFDLPKEKSSIIKVIGVGGGGSNAVNHMFEQKIDGVNFIICNTDAQAIALSNVPNKIQLGPHLTQGLGAGANPNIGRQATEESLEEIKKILEVNTKMAFITAGMGGGTGTGGAPIIARICKQLGILTVGIVTTPFAYEGKKRLAQAEEGINLLKENVDTLLVISNDKLRSQFGALKMKEAFGRADNVLATAAKCITDVINTTGQINVDFADVCTVMKDGGVAILGSAQASGENRAQVAIEHALTSPLLNDSDIRGAKWILININSAEGEHEFTMDEVEIIQQHLLSQAGEETDVIMGLGYDSTLGDQLGITLIATGFKHKDPFAKETKQLEPEEKIILNLETPKPVALNIPVTKDIRETESHIQTDVIEFKQAEKTEDTSEVVAQPEASIVSIPEQVMEEKPEVSEDPLMPVLLVKEEVSIEMEESTTTSIEVIPVVEPINQQEETTPVFVEISTPMDQAPAIHFFFDDDAGLLPMENVTTVPDSSMLLTEDEATIQNEDSILNTEDKTLQAATETLPSFLSKPKQIYVEEPVNTEIVESTDQALKAESIVQPEAPVELPKAAPVAVQEEEPVLEFELVVKDTQNAAEESNEISAQPIMNTSVEEPALPDESEGLRRRAAERVAKLRNLSFNVNASDPNSEYVTVPA
jgi:cell division protein FtsZ